MKVVAFVPIRLNSKRVVGKNLKLLGGKPMMCYLLETLVQVPQIDEVYVYCSSDEVREFLPAGVKLLKRDTALDSDTALGEEIYDAFVRDVDADVYMLAHTTSPFIKADTISKAIDGFTVIEKTACAEIYSNYLDFENNKSKNNFNIFFLIEFVFFKTIYK